MMNTILQVVVSGILTGSSYALVAMGIVIIYRSSGVFNFAHGAVILIGGIFFWTLISLAKWPLGACIVLTAVAAYVIGLGIEFFGMRPLLGQPPMSSVMMTLGLSIFFFGIYEAVWGFRGPVTFPEFFPMGHWVFGNIVIGQADTIIFFTSIVLFLLFSFFFRFTGMGKQVQAICESHVIAQSVGIDVSKVLSFVWGIGCICAALAGVLIGMTGSVGIHLNELVFMVIPVIILGGLESMGGALISGFIIGLVEMISAAFIDRIIGGGFRQVAPYIFLLIILIVKPYGLFGWKRIERI